MWIICCCVKLNLNHLALFQYRVNPSFPSKSRFSRQFPSWRRMGGSFPPVSRYEREQERDIAELGRFVHPLQGRVSSSSIKTEPDPSFEPVSSFRASYQIRAFGPRWKDERSSFFQQYRECKHPPSPGLKLNVLVSKHPRALFSSHKHLGQLEKHQVLKEKRMIWEIQTYRFTNIEVLFTFLVQKVQQNMKINENKSLKL